MSTTPSARRGLSRAETGTSESPAVSPVPECAERARAKVSELDVTRTWAAPAPASLFSAGAGTRSPVPPPGLPACFSSKNAESIRVSSLARGSSARTASRQSVMSSQAPLESWTLPGRWWTSRNCPVCATVQNRG